MDANEMQHKVPAIKMYPYAYRSGISAIFTYVHLFMHKIR